MHCLRNTLSICCNEQKSFGDGAVAIVYKHYLLVVQCTWRGYIVHLYATKSQYDLHDRHSTLTHPRFRCMYLQHLIDIYVFRTIYLYLISFYVLFSCVSNQSKRPKTNHHFLCHVYCVTLWLYELFFGIAPLKPHAMCETSKPQCNVGVEIQKWKSDHFVWIVRTIPGTLHSNSWVPGTSQFYLE